MANETRAIVLSVQDLRAVTRYAAESAQGVLEIFERAHPADSQPRDAINAAWTFARSDARGKALRDAAWAAQKAARDAATADTAYAARAAELIAGDDREVGAMHIEHARQRATPAVVDVLSRYPAAPPGGGRVGELLRSGCSPARPELRARLYPAGVRDRRLVGGARRGLRVAVDETWRAFRSTAT